MSIRRGGDTGKGTAYQAPLYMFTDRIGNNTKKSFGEVWGSDPSRVYWEDDFLGDVVKDQWGIYDVSASGTPTTAVSASVADGIYQLAVSNTNEATDLALYWTNYLHIPGNKRPYFEATMTVQVAPGANERMVFGLASTLDAVLDNTTVNAWFRLEASAALLAELDDNSTDTDDASTSTTITAATKYRFAIDCRESGLVVYTIADADGASQRQIYSKQAVLPSTGLQPMFYIQKDSGTGVPEIRLDRLRVSWDRST